jgi:hypothetical protein
MSVSYTCANTNRSAAFVGWIAWAASIGSVVATEMDSAGATVVPTAQTGAAVTGAERGGVLHPWEMSRGKPSNAIVRIERIIGSAR